MNSISLIKKLEAKAKREKLEQLLLHQIRCVKLPMPTGQYRFHDTRRWRLDWAWPDLKFAVEINGGEWINGAHNRGKKMTLDCEKIGEAMLLGWNIYVCTGAMVKKGYAVAFIERYFKILVSKFNRR